MRCSSFGACLVSLSVTLAACGSSDAHRQPDDEGAADGGDAGPAGGAKGSGGSGGAGGRAGSGGTAGSAGAGGTSGGSGGLSSGGTADASTGGAPDASTGGTPDGSVDASTADAESTDSAGDARTTPIVEIDFDGDAGLPPGVDAGTATLTPSQGYAPLGHPGNQFGPTFLRSLTGNTITITLTNLPPHTSLSIDFLFAAIDSLDGEGTFPAGDYFRVDLDGTTIFRETFANATDTQIQTYVPPVPEVVLARRVDLGFSGPGGYYTDSAYDMSLDPTFDDLAHTSSTAVILFTLEGAGVQDINDESWAIDNVRVSTK